MSFERVRDFIKRLPPNKLVFVLVLNGRVKCIDVKSERKIRFYLRKPDAVAVGTYDVRVEEIWLEQDLKAAGVEV